MPGLQGICLYFNGLREAGRCSDPEAAALPGLSKAPAGRAMEQGRTESRTRRSRPPPESPRRGLPDVERSGRLGRCARAGVRGAPPSGPPARGGALRLVLAGPADAFVEPGVKSGGGILLLVEWRRLRRRVLVTAEAFERARRPVDRAGFAVLDPPGGAPQRGVELGCADAGGGRRCGCCGVGQGGLLPRGPMMAP